MAIWRSSQWVSLLQEQGLSNKGIGMYNLIILANEKRDDHLLWIRACEKYARELNYRVINLTGADWLKEILEVPVDYLLAKPGGTVESYKNLYDERLSILVGELGYRVYPSLEEIRIYENKRYLSYWLEANRIPHPDTKTFYNKDEALEFINGTQYPIVAKLNIGASGNGVSILRTKHQAEVYVSRIFNKGISARTGPRLDIGKTWQRFFQKIFHPTELKERFKAYNAVYRNPQTGFCLFQEFIPHTFEWRVVRIGESFFAHKKIVRGEKASGGLKKNYDDPPLSLLSFVRELTDDAGFRSQAVDIFEAGKNNYLVNEMQCIFGQSDPYQMLVNGKPGRYIFEKNEWQFEEGMFNLNESYDLRVKDIIHLLKES